MSRPAISTEKLSDTLHISLCHRCSEHPQGYWLYDDTRGMNLAMGAPTKEAALLEALQYYQKHLEEVEDKYLDLQAKVNVFVGQFKSEEDE